jgi:hypothetical protein
MHPLFSGTGLIIAATFSSADIRQHLDNYFRGFVRLMYIKIDVAYLSILQVNTPVAGPP